MSRTANLFDLVRETLIVRDAAGQVRSWNTAAADLYGWAAPEAVGRSFADLFPDEPVELSSDVVDREVARRRSDGGEVLVEIRTVRRPAADGGWEWVEIGRDLTAQRQMEHDLRRSEFRYSSLFQAMAAGFWELDFAPVGALLRDLKVQGITDVPAYLGDHPEFVREMMRRTQVVDVNATTLEMFGIGDRSRLATSVEPYWPETSAHVYAAAVIAAIGRQSSYKTETRLRRQDGSEFDVLFTAAFPNEGLARGALLVGVIDIGERLTAQADLRTLQDEFAHAARVSMLGELTASIAHEVNQPLAAIATNAAASLRWIDRPEPEIDRVRALTARIGEDARRAADVIARVRGMAAKRVGERSRINVRDLVEETGVFLRHELQAREAKLAIHVPAALHVEADRTQLQQVLVNLIMNAVQAAAPLCPPRVTVGVGVADGFLELGVTDNGPGLGERIDDLFTSFFTTRTDGLGLGLPICHSIAEAHGGSINAANAPEGGAVFTIRLPVDLDHTKV